VENLTRVEMRAYGFSRLSLRSKARTVFSSLALIVALVWLLRSVLFVSEYGNEIVYVFMALLFLSNILKVRLNSDVFAFLSSLASSFGSFAVDLSLAFFFGGFFGLGSEFTAYTLAFFVGGLVLYVTSWSLGRLESPKRAMVAKEVASFGSGPIQLGKNLKAQVQELTGLPIRLRDRLLGIVTLNDIDLVFQTTFGPVKVPVRSPALVLSSRLNQKGRIREATEGEWKEASDLYTNRGEEAGWTVVKLPFVKVEDQGGFSTEVEVGPFKFSDTDQGSVIDIPPFIHVVSDEGSRSGRALVLSRGERRARVTCARDMVRASWNGWRIKTDGQGYTVVRHSGSYAKDKAGGLVVGSPGYSLRVSKDNVSVELPDTKLMATPSVLVLASGGKSQRISDEKLSRRFIESMLDVAQDQISELLAGQDPDPADVYVEIDSLLKEIR
jgi:hypothetical protein